MSDDGYDAVDNVLAKVPVIRSLLGLVPQKLNTEPRRIYFNQELPPEELNDGAPIQQFASNKIRTTKYTAMSFVPRNLALQFRSVANIFFLFVAIISSFTIFGAGNPGVGAVPIICILVITGIRDAFEDYRRFVLDREFNNAVSYVLLGIENNNCPDDQVSTWRLFKKRCSRAVTRVHRFLVRKPMPNWDLKSVVSENRQSMQSPRMSMQRNSLQLPRNSVEQGDDPSLTTTQETSGDGGACRQSSQSARRSTDTRSMFTRQKVPQNVRFKQQFWKSIQVGSIIKVNEGESVPADIIVLSTSEDDGSCFIETKNLDGESMLKPRISCPSTKEIRHVDQFADAQFFAEVEGANSDLDRFGWALHNTRTGKKDSLGPINFIARGTSVRNTKFVFGYVVYTGAESKIILNAGETPRKRSRVAKDLNFYIYISFLFLAILSVISTIVQRIKFGDPTNSLHFFEFGMIAEPIQLNAFVNFIASILMFQNIIPISLYISIEIVKTIQAYFIWYDIDMYDSNMNERCTPKTWNIGDDLGQIEFIFSDKTGTLTQNSMVFRKCTVNGKTYGTCFTEAQAGMVMRKGGNIEEARVRAKEEISRDTEDMHTEIENYYHNPFAPPEPELVSAEIYRDIPHNENLQQFALCLALCSTVVSETLEDGQINHKSESPDESTLVGEANSLGYTLVQSPKGFKYMNILGHTKKYKVLQTLFFSSDRKRMSTVVRDESGRTFVYCKGADVVIKTLLVQKSQYLQSDLNNLEEFADEGLRTLLLGYRELDSKWADEWCEKYTNAQLESNREELTIELSAEIEHDFQLLGGTGIEDKLQDDVPETIHKMGQAGIKVWCLTGDKPETAISIGYSCSLLEPGMEVLRVTAPTDVTDFLARFNLSGTQKEMKAAAANHKPPPPDFGLVIDGELLPAVLEDATLSAQFALLGKQCKSVLCCRVNPSQKAAVVSLIKNYFDVTALSIGDGANDVPMIQKADVGVGITGVEGRQAAMSADYSIAQFKYLQKLVLVHGHWSYYRTCHVIGILLYKNIVFTMCLFWNGIFNQFDNSYMCDYSLIVLYNSVFTSVPVITAGLFDQDIPADVMLRNPSLYARGILREGWTREKFAGWVVEGLYQSAVIYFLTWCNFWDGQFVSVHGIPAEYLTAIGVYIISSSVLTVNIEVLLISRLWDVITVVFEILSLLVMLAFICIYTSLTTSEAFYGAYSQTYGTVAFWASNLLTVYLSLAPKVMYKSIASVFFPSDVDVVRERERKERLNSPKDISNQNRDVDTQKDPERLPTSQGSQNSSPP